MKSVQLRQDNGLDNGKSVVRAVLQIFRCFFAVQAMKKFPGGVSQPKEWFSI